jgi:hypothetical protein
LTIGAKYDVFGHPMPHRGRMPREFDRFLLGGCEEQPDGFIKPEAHDNLETITLNISGTTGGSNNSEIDH